MAPRDPEHVAYLRHLHHGLVLAQQAEASNRLGEHGQEEGGGRLIPVSPPQELLHGQGARLLQTVTQPHIPRALRLVYLPLDMQVPPDGPHDVVQLEQNAQRALPDLLRVIRLEQPVHNQPHMLVRHSEAG
jgi:hypothetical protein